MHHKVVIIGTGPAGLTAAIYGARAALNPLVLAGLQHGGQLTTTTEVENFPGFRNGIMGPELMTTMSEQAERFGTKILYETVQKVDFSSRPLRLWTDNSTEITADSVIIATGATAKTLNLAKEKTLMGRGVSTCATCDGFFYKDKKVIVVGGGDSAMEEAGYLAKLASEVILVHRRAEFKASPIMLKRNQENPKIKFMLPYTVSKLLEDSSGLIGAELTNTENNSSENVSCDGLFYAIGHKPNSEVFSAFLDCDSHGYLKVHNFTETKVPGVFAAGDIADPHFRQAITAAGMGCQAALQAQRYLEELGI